MSCLLSGRLRDACSHYAIKAAAPRAVPSAAVFIELRGVRCPAAIHAAAPQLALILVAALIFVNPGFVQTAQT